MKKLSWLFISMLFLADAAFAKDDDKARAEMQKQLNQQVMSSPFDAGDIKKAEAYAEEAKKANVQPVARPPTYWAPGWTCSNLTSYQYYYYNDYRNCNYYHRFTATTGADGLHHASTLESIRCT